MADTYKYVLELNISDEVVEYFRNTAGDIEEMKHVLAHLIHQSVDTVVDTAVQKSYEKGFSDGWDGCMEELTTPSSDAAKFMH